MHVFWLLTMRFFCSQVSGDSTPKFEVDKSHPESKSSLAVKEVNMAFPSVWMT